MSEQMLTEEQCAEFRRLPLSFNDMVRAIHEAGRASKAAEYAHIRREARNAALEEAVEMCKVFAKEWRQIAEGANHWMCDAKADAAEDIAEELRALKDQP